MLTELSSALDARVADVLARVPWEHVAAGAEGDVSTTDPELWEERWTAARAVASVMARCLTASRGDIPFDRLLLTQLGRQSAQGRLPVSLLMRINFWLRDAAYSVMAEEAQARGLGEGVVRSAKHILDVESEAILLMIGERFDTELDHAQAELAYLARHDTLTGLANRSAALQELEMTLGRTRQKQGATAVLFIDIDQFKAINEQLGRGAADEVLGITAARITAAIRPGDVLARFGSDEFVAICHGVNVEGDAALIAQRVLEAISRPLIVIGRSIMVTASAGVALACNNETPEDMVARADSAMHEAKQRGGNGSRVAGPTVTASAIDVMVAAELSRALDAGQLQLYYQPLTVARTERIAGYEALLRWSHPTRGLVSPAEFIPLAEATGLIVSIGRWVIEEACRFAVQFSGTSEDGQIVSVNVSGRQLGDSDFPELVRNALEATGLPPCRLMLELTETMLATVPECELVLGRLKALGVKIAIDDFGTGYSSFSYLSRLPVHLIKIDRSFIVDLGSPRSNRAIVSGIVQLAHDLKLDVVAEGIETQAQRRAVEAVGCDFLQGFLLGYPMPAAGLGTPPPT